MHRARSSSSKDSARSFEKDLVLVGGGHAHVQVLRRWMMKPLDGVRLSVVVDRFEAVYSGMVPGAVAGDYAPHELEIDVLPLARRAGARCIHAAAVSIDPEAKRIELAGRPPLHYDVASLDIGSSVRGLDLPGVREHAISTRPIGHFVEAIEGPLAAYRHESAPLRVAIVGGGTAGVELALCVEARLSSQKQHHTVSIIHDGSELLSGSSKALRKRAKAAIEARGITTHLDVRVARIDAAGPVVVHQENSEEEILPADITLWATGAAPQPEFSAKALPTDARGFVRVRSTLQVEGYDDLFAVGDCAALSEHPWVPRAGVYAVRQGPVLDRNLRARLRDRGLEAYRPQRDFLALINLGRGRAVGGKWGFAFEGAWVWRLKDRIDRQFMRRFQVLDANGLPSADFPPPMEASDDGDTMECGGCAAKVGPSALQHALARLPAAPDDPSVRLGVADADDAAAFETASGDLLLATVDGFRAFTDDPWLVGRVAAINAVSDVQAKGGRARHALAIVTVPDEGPRRSAEHLYQVLAGVRAALDPLGVSLIGGHSTLGPEFFVGLSLTGDLGDRAGWLPLDGLRPGDALVLTKPLGSGVLLAADMRGLATARWLRALTLNLLRSNDVAAGIVAEMGAHACTDVSGFGLGRHLGEMLEASGVRAELETAALPLLPGALELLQSGLRSTYHEQNTMLVTRIGTQNENATNESAELAVLFDPQTAGGLLVGIDDDRCPELLRRLHAAGDTAAAKIGNVVAGDDGPTLGLRSAHG